MKSTILDCFLIDEIGNSEPLYTKDNQEEEEEVYMMNWDGGAIEKRMFPEVEFRIDMYKMNLREWKASWKLPKELRERLETFISKVAEEKSYEKIEINGMDRIIISSDLVGKLEDKIPERRIVENKKLEKNTIITCGEISGLFCYGEQSVGAIILSSGFKKGRLQDAV